MKTIAQSDPITPAIIGLAVLFAAVTFIGVIGRKVPVLSNPAPTSYCSSSSA